MEVGLVVHVVSLRGLPLPSVLMYTFRGRVRGLPCGEVRRC